MDAPARREEEAPPTSGRVRVASRVLLLRLPPTAAARLVESLELLGSTVGVGGDGSAALDQVRAWQPDLVLLALDPPDGDGYGLLRTLRAEAPALPIMLLASRGEEADKVLAFRLGADGYVSQQCGVLELLARVEALLRRRSQATRHAPAMRRRTVLHIGPLELEPAARSARLAGRPVALSPKEFDLLLALARRNGAAVSRRELLREVWGSGIPADARAVDVHIMALRRKLERDHEAPQLILTVRKTGYRLAAPTLEAERA